MTADQFNGRLKELSAITGSEQSMELFNQEYERLLVDVKADRDAARRYGHAERLKKILLIQAGFLMSGWIAHSRTTVGPFMTRGGRA